MLVKYRTLGFIPNSITGWFPILLVISDLAVQFWIGPVYLMVLVGRLCVSKFKAFFFYV